jgi:hypothetical protein
MTSVVDKLEDRGVKRGVLHQMAKDGQLVDLRCEMPTCYCPRGRGYFDRKSQPMKSWALNPDHYPRLKMHGGELKPENVRMAHVLCNNRDFAWRKRVADMLADRKSLQEIAAELTRKKVVPPNGKPRWTARMVRWAYIS